MNITAALKNCSKVDANTSCAIQKPRSTRKLEEITEYKNNSLIVNNNWYKNQTTAMDLEILTMNDPGAANIPCWYANTRKMKRSFLSNGMYKSGGIHLSVPYKGNEGC